MDLISKIKNITYILFGYTKKMFRKIILGTWYLLWKLIIILILLILDDPKQTKHSSKKLCNGKYADDTISNILQFENINDFNYAQ